MHNLRDREQRINLIYSHYLMGYDYEQIIIKSFDELTKNQKELIKVILENKNLIEEKIKSVLKETWSWERVNPIEKSILVNAVSEIILFDNKKEIVVKESNKIAKNLLVEDTPIKLITAIINKVEN